MKNLILAIIAVIAFSSCTKVQYEGLDLPDIKNVTPENIETKINVANIKVDPKELARLLKYFNKPLTAKAYLYFQDENKQQLLDSLPVTIEVKGNASAFYEMKSIGVLFDQPLNNDSVGLFAGSTLVNGHSLSTLYNIRFRNSGQDFGESMIKDIAYTELAIRYGINTDLMYYKPVHLFFNGKYYGFFNLRTENEEFGMAGLNETSVSGITTMDTQESDADFEWESGPEQPSIDFLDALEKRDAERLSQLMDVDNYIDYLLYQDCIGNRDWPNKNFRMYSDGGAPFRFILYDMDYAADRPKDPKLPEMEANDGGMAESYRTLKQLPGFYDDLKNRQKEIFKTLNPEKFNAILEELAENIEDEIPYMIAKHQKPASMTEWRYHLEILKREYYMQDKYIRDKHKL